MAHPKVDAELIAELTAQLEKNGLTELEWSEGDRSIRVVRNPAAAPAPSPPAQAAQAATSAPVPAPGPGDATPPPGPGDVASPMVGTVYLAAEPGARPFVQVGDSVTKGQTMLIVEAMKTMNPIIAPVSGTVEQILVADGEAVEYGQPLMTIA